MTEPATANHLARATLVARAQDGDLGAFEELVREVQQPLFALTFRILYDRAEAEDVVQETLVTAWRQLPTLADPQAFTSWIHRVATRRCLNVIRSRQRDRSELGRLEDAAAEPAATGSDVPDDPELVVEARDLRRDLDSALRRLPDDLRVCWVLNELYDLTYPQMAETLGVPATTVRGRLARARVKLAEEMSPWK